jgi:hypothetical protein
VLEHPQHAALCPEPLVASRLARSERLYPGLHVALQIAVRHETTNFLNELVAREALRFPRLAKLWASRQVPRTPALVDTHLTPGDNRLDGSVTS